MFAARRFQAEPMAMLIAARDGDPRRFEAPGLYEPHVAPLDDEAAAALIAARLDRPAPGDVVDKLLSTARGNPLALPELPTALSEGQLAGVEPILGPPPVRGAVEAAFGERVARLPDDVRLALLLVTVVFRSILAAQGRLLKAAAGFLLSIAAAMGITTWIFQDGHLADLFGVSQAGPIVSFLPVLLIGIVFGLAMDYEVFLRVADAGGLRALRQGEGVGRHRVRPQRPGRGRRGDHHDRSVRGLRPGRRPGDQVDRPALAVGVLADAFVVRLTLVPAVVSLLGRRAWWLPMRMGRLVPNLDIEGVKLVTAMREAPAPA